MPFQSPHYFNSLEQQAGDKAYNEQRFLRALSHYEKGLKNIREFTAKKLSHELAIQDGCTYAMTDIIRTCFDVLYFKFDDEMLLKSGEKYWKKVEELLLPLYKNAITIRSYPEDEIYTTPEIVTKTYEIVFTYCEKLSDKIADLVENAPEKTKVLLLNEAIKWMKRAIKVKEKYDSSNLVQTETHLGLLNLLEKKYLLCNEEILLKTMLEHIEDYNLAKKKMTLPKKVEILGFYLQCSENPTKQAEIIAQGKRLLPRLTKKDEKLVTYFNRCVAEAEKRSSVLLHEDIELNASKKNNEQGIDIEITAQNELAALPVSTNPPSVENHPNIMLETIKKNTTELTQLGHANERLNLSENNSIVRKKTVTWGTNFFHPIPKQKHYVLPKEYRNADRASAFMQAFNTISSNNSRPVFLASCLSLIGEFFSKNCEHLKREYFIVDNKWKSLAEKIFLSATIIEPQHEIAIYNLGKLYGKKPALTENVRNGLANKTLCMESLINLLTELKGLLKERTGDLIDELYKNITDRMLKIKLMKEHTPGLVAEMNMIFDRSQSENINNNNNNIINLM